MQIWSICSELIAYKHYNSNYIVSPSYGQLYVHRLKLARILQIQVRQTLQFCCKIASQQLTLGPFIYYVSKHNFTHFLGFLDPPPCSVSMFLVLRVGKKWHFLTPIPPTSAYIIYEWSLLKQPERRSKYQNRQFGQSYYI